MTPDQVIAAARRRLGVPFHHQGVTEAGMDCRGLLIDVARHLGVVPPDFDINNYSRSPDGSMRKLCDQYMTRSRGPEAGGVVLMRFKGRRWEQHIGIVGRLGDGDLSLIHADDARAKAVTEVRLQFGRYMTLEQAYRLPGVEYA